MAYLPRYYLFIRFDLTEFLLNLYSKLSSLLTNRFRQPLNLYDKRSRQTTPSQLIPIWWPFILFHLQHILF